MFPVFVKRRGADQMQFPSRQHRLEQIRGIHSAFRGTGPDDRVQLIDEQAESAPATPGFLSRRPSAVPQIRRGILLPRRARPYRGRLLVLLESLRHIAFNDPLCQPFHNGGLSDPRLPDQDGIVFCAAGQEFA